MWEASEKGVNLLSRKEVAPIGGRRVFAPHSGAVEAEKDERSSVGVLISVTWRGGEIGGDRFGREVAIRVAGNGHPGGRLRISESPAPSVGRGADADGLPIGDRDEHL